jgi:hypothetical protein
VEGEGVDNESDGDNGRGETMGREGQEGTERYRDGKR